MRKAFIWFLIIASLPPLLLALSRHPTDPLDAAAKAPLQETPPGDYPGPPAATPTTNIGYPAVPAATQSTPTPYPAAADIGSEGAPTATAVSVIGDDLAPTDAGNSPSTNAPLSTGEMLRNRILLWGGFLITFLIFGVSIYGAIAIYTRKQE